LAASCIPLVKSNTNAVKMIKTIKIRSGVIAWLPAGGDYWFLINIDSNILPTFSQQSIAFSRVS
jgi:hypothetical protein